LSELSDIAKEVEIRYLKLFPVLLQADLHKNWSLLLQGTSFPEQYIDLLEILSVNAVKEITFLYNEPQ